MNLGPALRAHQGVRFLLVGGSNTVVTYLLLVALSTVMDARVAYVLVFVLGLGYTTAMSARYVFGSFLTLRRAFAFVAWYLLTLLAGVAVVGLVADGHSPWVSSLVTVMVTAPLSFLGGRLVFKDRGSTPSSVVSSKAAAQ